MILIKLFRLSRISNCALPKPNNNLCLRIHSSFCKIPKCSKFSDELGLSRQLENTSTNAKNNQKSNVFNFQVIIWGCLCVVGSFVASAFVRQEIRDFIKMRYRLIILTLFPDENKAYLQTLEDMVKLEQQNFTNSMFSSSISTDIIQKCLQKEWKWQNLQQQLRYYSFIDKGLKNCLKYRINDYKIYCKYFEKLLVSTNYQQSQQMKTIVHFLIANADIRTKYLIALLYCNGKLRLSKKQISQLAQKISQEKEQVRIIQQKLAQIREQDGGLLNPYEFECQLKKKWIRFIQKYVTST